MNWVLSVNDINVVSNFVISMKLKFTSSSFDSIINRTDMKLREGVSSLVPLMLMNALASQKAQWINVAYSLAEAMTFFIRSASHWCFSSTDKATLFAGSRSC